MTTSDEIRDPAAMRATGARPTSASASLDGSQSDTIGHTLAKGDELPFTPFDSTLRDVLRQRYIKNVARWLMGKSDNSVLPMSGDSVWESALTLRFMSEAADIFTECNEEARLREQIRYKSGVVTRWLLEKVHQHDDGTYCWEHVTWDTSVSITALVIALKKYGDSLSESEKARIADIIVGASVWLHLRFARWELEVKYPFGPADVAQIVNALFVLHREAPELYERVRESYYEGGDSPGDLAVDIVRYLLHRKSERTVLIASDSGEEEVVCCWWDDYFSTAEGTWIPGRAGVIGGESISSNC